MRRSPPSRGAGRLRIASPEPARLGLAGLGFAGFGLAGLLVLATGGAQAASGDFFKNLMGGGGGGGDGGGSGGGMPDPTAPRAQDPDEAYCPVVDVVDGGAVLQSFAGAAGDGARLRNQVTFGRLSRECTPRTDGSVTVKVGVQVRVLLGPAGAPGRFEAPLTIAVRYDEKTLDARTRRVGVVVPAGSAQGTEAVIEDGLSVPADKAVGYEIVVGLTAAPARTKAKAATAKAARKAGRPATNGAPAGETPTDAATAGQ